ncbi:hypothetical protein AB0C70_39555 [Streptomyces sp. NPDC048564]|uniref:hypothetical protein n=1 Tax=Streptomyces sp. NPDC048564 TaxID=3155760 RepID=UPI003416E62A
MLVLIDEVDTVDRDAHAWGPQCPVKVSVREVGPKRDGACLSLYQVSPELQLLLAVWNGDRPICHRNMPEPIST